MLGPPASRVRVLRALRAPRVLRAYVYVRARACVRVCAVRVCAIRVRVRLGTASSFCPVM